MGQQNIDTADTQEAFRDLRYWTGLGVVEEVDGSTFIREMDNGSTVDVYVNVRMMPRGRLMQVHLNSSARGGQDGMWSIPPAGTEVTVAFPAGDWTWRPYIIAIGNTLQGDKSVPDELTEDNLVVANAEEIIVRSTNNNIVLNASNAQVKLNGEDKQVTYKDARVDCGKLVFTIAPIGTSGGSGVTAVQYYEPNHTYTPIEIAAIAAIVAAGGAEIDVEGIVIDGSGKVKLGI